MILIGIWLYCATVISGREIDFVLALWRHGKRSPMVFIDEFGDNLNIWPNGKGQLTQEGVEIHQRLGRFLRERYDGFISKDYKREELYVRSTDRDRTLLSAVSNLGAFYNMTTPGYMSIPIHTMPVDTDHILRFPVTGCNKYDSVKHELSKTPMTEALNEKYRSELDKLQKISDFPMELTVNNMWEVADSIDCHIANYLNDIEGYSEEDLSNWRYIAAKGMENLFTDLEHDRRVEISRLNGGNLLGDIITQLQAPLVQPDISDKPVKYLVYSAHDTTLSAAMIAMDIWDNVQPYYASALLFERYNDNTVKISFVNGTMEEDLHVHDYTNTTCQQSPCGIENLRDAWASVIPERWESECRNDEPTPEALKSSETSLGIFLGVSWLLFIIYAVWSRPKTRSSDQLNLISAEFSMDEPELKNPWQSVPSNNQA